MTCGYRVELTAIREHLQRARLSFLGVDLGLVQRDREGSPWHVAFLMGKNAICRHTTLDGVRLELERYCKANPDEVDDLVRGILAARERATSPEPQEPAPELQGAMPL